MSDSLKEEIERVNSRIEVTIEIIIEHLRDSETRLQQMENEIKELKNAASEDVSK